MAKRGIAFISFLLISFFCLLLLSSCSKNYFQVSFDSNGGTYVPTQKIAVGGCAAEPEKPVKNGYIFDGWFAEDESSEFDFESILTGDKVLTARWIYSKVTVRFDSGGGSAVPVAVVEKGDAVARPETPVNGFKVFKDWYKEGERQPYDFSNPVNENIVLKAVWETVRVTVYFDSNGGNILPAKTTEKGENITPPAEPVREGYDFDCWLGEDGVQFDFDSNIIENTVLAARWKPKSFEIRFDPDGGTVVPSQYIQAGKTAKETSSYKFGYKFKGWSEHDTKELFDFSAGITRNVSLKANWEKTDAFDRLPGQWTGEAQKNGKRIEYSLNIESDGVAVLILSAEDGTQENFEAGAVTSGTAKVILFFDNKGIGSKIEFDYDGASLETSSGVYSEPLKLFKYGGPLYDPAELAGHWAGTAEAEVFGEAKTVLYTLDIDFDGSGTFCYDVDGIAVSLIVVAVTAQDDCLVLNCKSYEGAEETIRIVFRPDEDMLYCDSAIFGEKLNLKRISTG